MASRLQSILCVRYGNGPSEDADVSGTPNRRPPGSQMARETAGIEANPVRDILAALLDKASQPRHASGNACIKLCYFVEQCRNSKEPRLRDLAFSEKACIDLFNFYIEWNERNQHRSMRQVLELLTSLVSLNSDRESTDSITKAILQRVLSIIIHQSAQPLAKPAFKSLECFLGKGTISTAALIGCYEGHIASIQSDSDTSSEKDSLWDSFMAEVFSWLTLPDVSPAAGKLLVTLFVKLGGEAGRSLSLVANHTVLWQRWIRAGLSRHPETLENIKNYLFPPLFKLDRSGSILFLGDLNSQGSISGLQIEESNAQSLLQLAAIEVGKKLGLMEETSTFVRQRDSKKKPIVLDESAIGELLTHTLDTVRSLAFSVLVSSSSSIRPFSKLALNLLQTYMSILYADTDAKFRNEILSNTRHMIERLRGALAYMTRELENTRFLLDMDESSGSAAQVRSREVFNEINNSLKLHERFVQWYLEFLFGELIPTASYQRHITALKAFTLLIRSGILGHNSSSTVPKVHENATTWPFTIKLFTSGNMRLLLDLLMDPFEDVRISAGVVLKSASWDDFKLDAVVDTLTAPNHLQCHADLSRQEISIRTSSISTQSLNLSSLSSTNHVTPSPQALLDFIDRAQDAASRTGRADYGDGFARSWEILYCLCTSSDGRLKLLEDLIGQLERKVDIAEEDLARAVVEAPLHGSFAALNFIWDAVDYSNSLAGSSNQQLGITRWDSLHSRMVECCKRSWNVVRGILCNDSPEGHLPSDIDEIDSVGTKDILSYSFRATHESSNLMRNLIGKLKLKWNNGSPVLSVQVFSDIGHLTFEQLSNLRHRGAFSTVSLTFTRCCQLTQFLTPNLEPDQKLLEQWYQGALQCISEQASTTRRSAGIPALITGILSSNAQKPGFENVMDDLMGMARTPVKLSRADETNLPQVHSMNCLKEIFRSSLLGKRADNDIAECLQIAADSLNSEVWAIRNCGLLLLRSLIDALFGTNESKVAIDAGWDGRSVKLSYDKYPALPALLIKLLDADTSLVQSMLAPKISSVESMFPALDIVRRAGPPTTHRKEIFRSVSQHLGSKVWHVREIAARTMCTMLLHSDWLSEVIKLMESSAGSTNRLHGVLMAVKFVLDRRLALHFESAIDGLDQLASFLESPKMWTYFKSGCPEILAAYLEVSNSIARILIFSRKSRNISTQLKIGSIMDQLFFRDTYEEFLGLIKTYPTITVSIRGTECSVNTALACNAILHRSVFSSALREDTLCLQNVIAFATTLDIDVVLAAVEVIPDTWGNHTSVGTLLGLIKTYMGAIEATKSPEVRATAIFNLAEVVDRMLGRIDLKNFKSNQNSQLARELHHTSLDLNEMVQNEIQGLGTLLQNGMKTPSLSNAEIRISGSLLNLFNRAFDTFQSRMEAWGKLLGVAGASTNDVGTRHAAAAALASFYSNPCLESYMLNDECVLPSMFSLYDTLNDDDDEIRNMSAQTVSALLQKSLIPLAARLELAEYVSKIHARAPSFAWNMVYRMTGSKLETVDNIGFRLKPIGGQLQKAMREDDSLFVEEEQNLFVDEVREAKLWSKIFKDTALNTHNGERVDFDVENTWSQPHTALATWVIDGLLTGCSLLNKDDGPLGWTSKPAVFSLLTRLLLCANATIQRHERLATSATGRSVAGNRTIGGIIFALNQFVSFSKEKKIHESLLLIVRGKSLLPLVALRRVVPDSSS
ncbi:tRNA (cytidine(32)-2 -O)-methyltransferase non-catalytic subunit TRM732 [Hyphodiscus hymeniophilus]|uniref:tRNA (Cytidine(32)-2 -O)-methyltransferase non-catalytic subunit TRM732 n=1 Tax=Hyphodiscus hymeniophilus TaxID=353542 RepID=A0A9P6VGN7_9HELO|nr:tRNA (cytidine(32)-2 -O)-methyltransferase non-catalytic subunit TRM732 [Hyphodiscus hymeniophilus]